MWIKTNVFSKPIAGLYKEHQVIDKNLAFILHELPSLPMPDDLRQEITATCREFQSAQYDVRNEIRNLEDKLGMHPGEAPSDPGILNRDPHVTMDLIKNWVSRSTEEMDALVRTLRERAEEDPALGIAEALVTESAVNILRARQNTERELNSIGTKWDRLYAKQ